MSKRMVDEPASAILEAARDLLASEGQSALTVRRIAACAGGSTMNVYSRFGGKDGVVDALLVEGFDMLREAIAKSREEDGGDPTRIDLERCADTYRDFALSHRTHYELMFDRAIPGFEMSETSRRSAATALHSLADRVQEAMDAGTLRSGDALATATIFWAACHGTVSLEMKGVGPPFTNWNEIHRELVRATIVGLGGSVRPTGSTASTDSGG